MKSMRQLVVMGLLFGATFLTVGAALAEAPKEPALLDLAQLNLRVADYRVVDSLKLGTTELKAPKDEKLVVVTLRGAVDKPGRLTVTPETIKASYSWTVSSSPPREQVGKTEGKAAQISDGSWAAHPTATFAGPRDVTIDVAVSVPTQVSQFYIIWDMKKGLRGPVDLGKTGAPRPTPHP